MFAFGKTSASPCASVAGEEKRGEDDPNQEQEQERCRRRCSCIERR